MKNEKTILQEAQEIVDGDRAVDYGDMKTSFTKIAAGWTQIIGSEVTPQKVGLMMIWMKMCRETNKHKRDNLVDICGYAHCIDQITK